MVSAAVEPWTPRFSTAARALAATARTLGLQAPGFRSPPNVAGAMRTLRRMPDGRCVIAVRAAGRPFPAVIDDLVDGVIAANALTGETAERARRALFDAAMAATAEAA